MFAKLFSMLIVVACLLGHSLAEATCPCEKCSVANAYVLCRHNPKKTEEKCKAELEKSLKAIDKYWANKCPPTFTVKGLSDVVTANVQQKMGRRKSLRVVKKYIKKNTPGFKPADCCCSLSSKPGAPGYPACKNGYAPACCPDTKWSCDSSNGRTFECGGSGVKMLKFPLGTICPCGK